MSLHERYGLTKIINAAGSFTPLGVSRSASKVGQAAAEALGEFFVIDELQDAVSEAIARYTGAQAGAVTHCVSAAIAVSVAATMAGRRPDRVAALPDTQNLPNRVVIPRTHAVDYGHPILQDIRLAGAEPVLAGSDTHCGKQDIARALEHTRTACLLLVSSRLVAGQPVNVQDAVAAAHRRGVPAIVDAAAQDMRIGELLTFDFDLVLVSAHKYLASPTAGLVIGKKELVSAVRAQETGIGRAMKPTKEAICGVLAAIELRENMNLGDWRAEQASKANDFAMQVAQLPGVSARVVADSAGMPFSRVHMQIDARTAARDAAALIEALKSGIPSIRVMEHGLVNDELIFEMVALTDAEAALIQSRLIACLS